MVYNGLKVSKAVDWHVPVDFRCRIVDFARYLDASSIYDRRVRMGRMYWTWYNDRIVGYMMLAMGHVGEEGQGDLGIDTYGMIPALTIAHLATDERHERQGVGSHMVHYAIGIARKLAKDVGCRVVLANSELDAVGFYKKMGFAKFTSMLPLHTDCLSRDSAEHQDGKTDEARPLIPMYLDIGVDDIPLCPGNVAC